MIPGLENAEFARYGVMHANTFIDAPRMLNSAGRLIGGSALDLDARIYVAGQLAGTEGYCEAIRPGLHVALSVAADAMDVCAPEIPQECAYGALMAYASDPNTVDYQPMHVNFGIMQPLQVRVRNKGARYEAYAARGRDALFGYVVALDKAGLLGDVAHERCERAECARDAGWDCSAAVADVVACAIDASGK
jgi:methylenetetrahydrofolate--tRNA-(uracil-5-)-methyltransferase